MKKKFEIYEPIIISAFIFIVLIIVFFIYLFKYTYKEYEVNSAVVSSYDLIEVVVNTKSLNTLNKNKTLYIDGKKHKIKIIQVIRNIIKKKQGNYHQLLIETTLDKKYKNLDVITVSIYKQDSKVISIFKSCWKGASDAEN